ncbi:MAG: hypothetical protein KatS3mg111_2565 [Pirellulaceae bacterium]|nr:MAG: hypothetical protein KatS3mg111_2565 [Pirellulaceae bacterium]
MNEDKKRTRPPAASPPAAAAEPGTVAPESGEAADHRSSEELHGKAQPLPPSPSGESLSASSAEGESGAAPAVGPVIESESTPSEPLRAQAASGDHACSTIGPWLLRRLLAIASIIGVVLLILFAIGLAQRIGWLSTGDPTAGDRNGESNAASSTKRYICPMMCVPPSTQPGRCPVCGMELVEATSSPASDGKTVVIDPVARRLVGIRTAMVIKQKVDRTIRTIGAIDYDQSRLATIAARVDGRIERLYADYVGVPVQKNDDLALLYSPDLYTAQVEYLSALERQGNSRFADDARLVLLAEEKLRELGLTDSQIEELRQSNQPASRLRIKSPQQGTVIEKAVVEGDYVSIGQTIHRVADLSSVWLMLDLFPDDAAVVRYGQEVEAEIDAAPGVVFTGRVAFVDPTVDRRTRTVKVRVEMLNLDGKLRPGDYASARIRVPALPRDQVYDPALAGKYISPMHPQIVRDQPGQCPICGMELIPTSQLGFSAKPLDDETVITVPRPAVLMAGGNSVVYVEAEPGRFEVRRVRVAALTDQWAIIATGLKPGEIVATDGNFLIDSQSQLAGNPSLLAPSKAPQFPPGPLELPPVRPRLLTDQAAQWLDDALAAYFDIHSALAADMVPPVIAVERMSTNLQRLLASRTWDDASIMLELQDAVDAANNLTVSLDTARIAFRRLSHSLLRIVHRIRGPQTMAHLYHFYCPMVPGGGGDWMQNTPELKNPYWGAAMISCGELVRKLGIATPEQTLAPEMLQPLNDNPFSELQLRPLAPPPSDGPLISPTPEPNDDE